MCTLVILRRQGHEWPLLVAGNRDEMLNRPWFPPARHWEDRPDVVAALDRLAGGSWIGLNDYGVIAAVMNREGSLGPAPDKRSRGELVLEALDHTSAHESAQALSELDPQAYRSFNLFIGDCHSAYLLVNRDRASEIGITEIDPGLHMLTAYDIDDTRDPRIRYYLPKFRDVLAPDPDRGNWDSWLSLLASRHNPDRHENQFAMNFELPTGFGTCCSHCIALSRHHVVKQPLFLFSNGPPHQADFQLMDIS